MRNTLATKLLFELSQPGRGVAELPASDVPAPLDELLPAEAMSQQPPPLPELAEPDVVNQLIENRQNR